MVLNSEGVNIEETLETFKPTLDTFFKTNPPHDERSIQHFFLFTLSLFCKKYGLKCYISGGYIRDRLLGIEVKHADIDFNISAMLTSAVEIIQYASRQYFPSAPIIAGKALAGNRRYNVYLKTKLVCTL